MGKEILFSILVILAFVSIFSLVLAQGTGEGGATNISKPYIDPEIYGAFNSSEWIRIIVYFDAEDISNMGFKDLEEREEYIRNQTKSTFSYIPQTKMKIVQTSLEPGYFGAEITKEGFDILISDSKISKIYLDTMGSVALSQSVPRINADDVWNLGYTGSGKKVCIIDTGVNTSHPYLQGKIIDEYCYCSLHEGGYNYCCPDHTSYDDDAEDNNGHGTHVAGIVASQDSTFKGVASQIVF